MKMCGEKDWGDEKLLKLGQSIGTKRRKLKLQNQKVSARSAQREERVEKLFPPTRVLVSQRTGQLAL
jgi:hypothetical protein